MAESVAARLAAVRERIGLACERSGRPASAVKLIAVSKTHPASAVLEAVDAGQTRFGENRVQEALAKQPEVGRDLEWHLIGPLQRNKARHAVGAFALLHGVDSERLLAEIDRRAAAAGIVQDLLLQVRLGGEATKSGIDPAGLPALLDAAAAAAAVRVAGLMTIPPPVERAEQARGWFAELRELARREGERSGLALPELSMGMTGDFEVAVEEGATLVRVGTAIFGARRT